MEKYELENDNNNDDDDVVHNYIITTNVNRNLSKELKLGIDDIKLDERFSWEPPKEHGLCNSNFIIPKYYHLHKNPHKIFSIDYYEIIKDDIRNFRQLNKYQLEYIKELSHEDKNELLELYNNCIISIEKIIN